jgi:hypothetical protein
MAVVRRQGVIGLYKRGLVLCSVEEDGAPSGPEDVRVSTVQLLRVALLSLSRTDRCKNRAGSCQSRPRRCTEVCIRVQREQKGNAKEIANRVVVRDRARKW